MSELAMASGRPAARGAFSPVTVALMLLLGVVGFIGTLVLGAYAPDFRRGGGGAHALSQSAVGYSGVVRLMEALGREPQIIRSEQQLGQAELVVLTPERGAVPMDKALAARRYKRTLLVLPKWDVAADKDHAGWVRRAGLRGVWDPEGVLAPKTKLKIARRRSGGRPLVVAKGVPAALATPAPRPVQVITGSEVKAETVDGEVRRFGAYAPLVTDGRGGTVLAKMEDGLFILSDPDLLANHGIADLAHAEAAVALLDHLAGGRAQGVAFDVTLNGLGRSPSPLRLAFEPPFLAVTLTIAAALLLAGWQALARFGAAARPERAIAFGKRALLDNSALLVRKARRESRLGGRYADAVRERARALFGVPAALKGAEVDAYLDRMNGQARFSELAARAAGAETREEVLAAARALNLWVGDKS